MENYHWNNQNPEYICMNVFFNQIERNYIYNIPSWKMSFTMKEKLNLDSPFTFTYYVLNM